jgi:hypothetical protein
MKFYINHPDRFIELANDISRDAFRLQIPYIGHYEIGIGKPPRAMIDRFNLWDKFRNLILPGSFITLIMMVLFNFLAALFFRFRVFSKSALRFLPELHLTILAGAISQFIATILGEGTADVVKHLFFFNMGLDFCLVIFLLYALVLLNNRSPSRPGWSKQIPT